jgi:GT2 family glycosyltransferase
MPSSPDASVVVLNYDGADHLEACLGSLRAQSFPRERFEVIVADNRSTDSSAEICARLFPEVRFLAFPKNHGFATGNNLAAREARGRVVVFLNNDTRVDPGWLAPLVERVDAARGVGCAASLLLSFEGDRLLYEGGRLHALGFGYQEGLGDAVPAPGSLAPRETAFACGCAMAVDRRLFLECGGFDDDYFAYYEDVDLGWRLWTEGQATIFVPESICFHKGDASFQKTQLESRQILWNRNPLFSVYKNYEEENARKLLPLAVLLTVERAMVFLLHGSENERESILAMFADVPAEFRAERLAAVGRAPLAALEQFVTALPRASAKRRAVQERRKLSDADVARRVGLSLRFDDQVNVLRDRSFAARLAPHFALDSILSPGVAEDVRAEQLRRLENAVSSYRLGLDALENELRRKTEDQERKAAVIDDLVATAEARAAALRERDAELAAIRAKWWYRAVMKSRAWRKRLAPR